MCPNFFFSHNWSTLNLKSLYSVKVSLLQVSYDLILVILAAEREKWGRGLFHLLIKTQSQMSIVSQGLMYMPSQRSFLSPGIILVPVDIPVPSLVVEVFACLFVCWSILSLLFPSPRWNGIPPVPKSNSNCCSYPHKNMPMYHKRKKGRRESRESLWFLLLWLLYSSPPDFL